MRNSVIAIVLILLPAAVYAQSSNGAPVAGANTGKGAPNSSGASTYGPPAPSPAPNVSSSPRVNTSSTGSAGGTQTAHRHGGHRRGAYAGADGGVVKPQ
jgi:hypothetical protein